MGCVEGLNNAMIGKVATEASEKTRVKAIDETSTHADGILPLLDIRSSIRYLDHFYSYPLMPSMTRSGVLQVRAPKRFAL